MRYTDNEIEAVERRICQLKGCDRQAADPIFEWAWGIAEQQQRLGFSRAKEIYLGILATVIERITSEGRRRPGIITMGNA